MSDSPDLPEVLIEPIVRRSLEEDLGSGGDITSRAVISPDATARAHVVAREGGLLAGVQPASLTFRLVDPTLELHFAVADGAAVEAGEVVATVEGRTRSILTAERTALNFLGHLSGVATATGALVAAVVGTDARICCTRKTTPGLRSLEKQAVRAGGGVNHRHGLGDAILIKDNHVAVCGCVAAAIGAAREQIGPATAIELEVDTLEQLNEALEAGATALLLDNMAPSELRRAVELTGGRAVLEASGRVTSETVRAIAESGVDYISSGSITHSAPVLDFGLDIAGTLPSESRD
ncbi:MAG: carboxylating nicotinate-nucleotide diphosphorylase [Longimicrobiales bacterium]